MRLWNLLLKPIDSPQDSKQTGQPKHQDKWNRITGHDWTLHQVFEPFRVILPCQP